MANKFLDTYDEVFTPSAPMEDRDLFFGREQELVDFRRAIKRKGVHPVVVGNRGVGKTSLVKMALRELDPSHKIVKVTCNARMSFHEFAVSMLDQLGIPKTEVEKTYETAKKTHGKAGFFSAEIGASGEEKETTKHASGSSIKHEPWGLFTFLEKQKKKIVIVLDEYDRIDSNKKYSKHFHENVADLMKTLADNAESCTSKLVVVGIGASAQKLLGEHESIERSAKEIYIRPLRNEDVNDFLASTEDELNFSFNQLVKDSILLNANGYPYYVHLVALKSIDVMVDRDNNARNVEIEDYEKGVDLAVEEAFRSVLRKYQEAVKNLSSKEELLIEKFCYYPLNQNVMIERFREHMKIRNVMEPKEFDSTLLKLNQSNPRLVYFSRNTGILRFSDPLMGTFLKSKIYKIRSGQQKARPQLDLDI